MGSKWRKAKLALGCLHVPSTLDDSSPSLHLPRGFSGGSSSSSAVSPSNFRSTTPTPSSSGLRVPRSSKKTCAICLATMKPGQGNAIFTAECSHSFHFHCVTSNVKHGNQTCPVCRAKWKEVPFHNPGSSNPQAKSWIHPIGLARDDAWMAVGRQLPPPRIDPRRQIPSIFRSSEPSTFDDDEALDDQHEINGKITSSTNVDNHCFGMLQVKTYPELSSVPKSVSHNNFSILIHLKAPLRGGKQNVDGTQNLFPPISETSRAPIDLVTVLDVSGSMGGTKLALLKRAMGFVIQNLGPSDRLSVIAFSSTARRIIPLRLMTDIGRQEALHAVNSLNSNGGTNIAEGLKKGAKIIVDRKWKNPVASIILLSDGQDTYTVNSRGGGQNRANYQSLLPISINHNGGTGFQIPVHAFGFGMDHDAASMHSISEISGGTFSFIEAEGVIQDAFAQCIGGLLSVVVQGLQVQIECVSESLQLGLIKAGSYKSSVMADARTGCIDVGDLYAEEERDFLVTINIPIDQLNDEMSLLKVGCFYKDPITKESLTLEEGNEVKIQRHETVGQTIVSMEVDRQRNRLHAAEAMGEARIAAEKGDLSGAVSVLDSCRKTLAETASARGGDRLCAALDAELKEMQDRMASRRVYETSGRAYVLSGLSSHSWQRATARGDSTDSTSLVQAYQTPSMVDMVTRSQTMVFDNPPPQQHQRKLRQALSFPARPHPR